MRYLAPPNAVITVDDHIPHLLTYEFGVGSGLLAAGVAAVSAAITTYLSAAKLTALLQESQRHGSGAGVPAAIVGALQGSYPVLDADVLEWKLDVGTAPEAGAPAVSRRGPMEQRVRLRTNQGARLLERTLHRPANDPALAEAAAFAEEMVEDEIVCG